MRTIGKAIMMAAMLAALPAQAQQPAAKIAVIQSSQFSALPDLAQAQERVDREFKPRADELQRIADRAVKLDDELQKLKTANAPQAEQKSKLAQLEAVNLEYRRVQEDLETQYTKRAQTVIGPVMLRIQDLLAKFLQGQGFTNAVDIDAGQSAPAGAIDKTKEFMTWYQAQPRP